MTVTVFTKNACPQCKVTKTHLTKRDVEFHEINIEEEPEWRERLMNAGFLQMPVVLVADEDVWSGYSSDSIDEWFPKAS